jgi:hypothetical protein
MLNSSLILGLNLTFLVCIGSFSGFIGIAGVAGVVGIASFSAGFADVGGVGAFTGGAKLSVVVLALALGLALGLALALAPMINGLVSNTSLNFSKFVLGVSGIMANTITSKYALRSSIACL